MKIMKIPSTKTKYQTNTNPSSVAGYCGGRVTKIQNSKQTQWSWDINLVIGMFRLRAAQALAPRVGISDLDIICDLRFAIWDFSIFFRQANYCYLSQLATILMFPWGVGHG